MTLPANLALWMPWSTGGTKLSTGTMIAFVSGCETRAALIEVASLSRFAVVNSVSAMPQLGHSSLNLAMPLLLCLRGRRRVHQPDPEHIGVRASFSDRRVRHRLVQREDARGVVVEGEVGVGLAATGRGDAADDDLDALGGERVEGGAGHLVVDEGADDTVDLLVAGRLEAVSDGGRVELAVADLDLGTRRGQGLGDTDARRRG